LAKFTGRGIGVSKLAVSHHPKFWGKMTVGEALREAERIFTQNMLVVHSAREWTEARITWNTLQ